MEIQPVKNLFFKSNIGADNAYYLNKVISPTFEEGALRRTTNSLSYDQNHYLSITFSNTLRYNWNLNEDNNFKFLVGTEYIKTDVNFQTTRKEGYTLQTEEYFTLNAGTGNTNVTGGSTGNRLFSQFGRIDYAHADKYLAALTLRRDGSSRFGANNQYGIFPAASVGWKIDKEGLMQHNTIFSELKLRAGIGPLEINKLVIFHVSAFSTPGTEQLRLNLPAGFLNSITMLELLIHYQAQIQEPCLSGFVQTQAANPNLKWETTDEIIQVSISRSCTVKFMDHSIISQEKLQVY